MTFCEMYKNDGGCPGCPNRYICNNSTVTNPKCNHNYRHPCEECAHFYYGTEYDRNICHNDSNEGYAPSSTAGTLYEGVERP